MPATGTYKIIFITGVSGSGKTTIGQLLAQKTGYAFYDADDFHPQQNIDKMKAGQPLTDADRQPWLDKMHDFAEEAVTKNNIILACSALKAAYRKSLSRGIETHCRWVLLNGSYQTILQRLQQRQQHYMPASLLQSQFDALEAPGRDTIAIDVCMAPGAIVDKIISAIG